MRRAIAVAIKGTWPVVAAIGIATLDHADRRQPRLKLKTDAGAAFLLDLERPTHLCEGDGLKLADGSYVLVRAATEDCLLIRHGERAEITRLAWHLGQRQLPIQILPDGLLTLNLPAAEAIIAALGAEAERVWRGFEPEAGSGGDPTTHLLRTDEDDDHHNL